MAESHVDERGRDGSFDGGFGFVNSFDERDCDGASSGFVNVVVVDDLTAIESDAQTCATFIHR